MHHEQSKCLCFKCVFNLFPVRKHVFHAVSARWMWNQVWIQDVQIFLWKKAQCRNGLLNKWSVGSYKVFFSSSAVFTETLLWNFWLGTIWSNWPLWILLGASHFWIKIPVLFFRFKHNDNPTCFRKSEEKSSQNNTTCSPSGTLSLQFYL